MAKQISISTLVINGILIFSISQLSAKVTVPIEVEKQVASPVVAENKPIQVAHQEDADTLSSPINVLDYQVDAVKKHLEQFSSILSGLAKMVHEDKIPTLKNKSEALRSIQLLNQIIHSLQKEKFANSNPQELYNLVDLLTALIEHLRLALKQGCKNIPPFNLMLYLAKKGKSRITLTPSYMNTKIGTNKQLLEYLQYEADHAGLRWYNRAYRTIDKLAIEPCTRYQVPQRALYTTAGAIGLLWIWWRLHYASFQQYVPAKIHDLWGNPAGALPGQPEQSEQPQQTGRIPKGPLGPLGRLDDTLYRLISGKSPIGHYCLGFAGAELMKEYVKNIQPWLSKKINAIHNRLKGGAFINEANKSEGKLRQVSFDDIVGAKDKVEYFRMLIDYVVNPEPYDRLGLTPQRGVLCEGPTRAGKTYLVHAWVNELYKRLAEVNRKDQVEFIQLDAATINKHGIDSLIYYLQQRPYKILIIFIDEIDLLGLQRTGKNETLSQFLVAMGEPLNSSNSDKQVIIIGATNRPETLDVALRQQGRFGKELFFTYPSQADRMTFLKNKLDKLSIDITEFNIERLAQQTDGYHYEALNFMIDSALLKARIRQQPLTQKYIDDTLDEELRNIMPHSTTMLSTSEKDILATHFAGHALTLHLLQPQTKLAKVTIKPVKNKLLEEHMAEHLFRKDEEPKQKPFEQGAVFTHKEHDSINLMNRDEKIKMIKFHLAGNIAEEVLLGSCGYSCHAHDMNEALQLALSLVSNGLDLKTIPAKMQQQYYQQARELIEQCKKELIVLFKQQQNVLAQLKTVLAEKETMSEAEVLAAIQPKTAAAA